MKGLGLHTMPKVRTFAQCTSRIDFSRRFVFSRRFSGEKSPTITVDFFFFFRQTTDLIVYVPLFIDFTRSLVLVSTVFTRFTVNPAVTGSSPCFSQKLFRATFFGTVRLFQFFFRHCATLFRFFLPSKGTSKFFLIFCSKLKCDLFFQKF